ncbi:MAG TPA: hypothetical protein VFN57_13065 [Thermomicrobiaceae bacterium]|nr:hypothetical protein [Thermomicrobiaceae bacterium]
MIAHGHPRRADGATWTPLRLTVVALALALGLVVLVLTGSALSPPLPPAAVPTVAVISSWSGRAPGNLPAHHGAVTAESCLAGATPMAGAGGLTATALLPASGATPVGEPLVRVRCVATRLTLADPTRPR